MKEEDKVVQAERNAERERLTLEFNNEVDAAGIENMPVIPKQLQKRMQIETGDRHGDKV